MKPKIPIYKTTLSGREANYVRDCLRSGWISSRGKFVNRFEKSFAEFIDGGYATSVSNGTVALHLALHTFGIGPGDEVIVPTLTYVATVNAISIVGATPVFVDSEQQTWNIDCSKIESKITKNTKAILVVHLYGAMCDMNSLKKICRKHNLFLIEDAAEAFGSKFNGKHAGTFGNIATFSFFGNKTITTGEGGMVVSHNKKILKKAAFLKSQAVSSKREYWHTEIGFNYRMTNICAAIGLAQLERAQQILYKKRQIAEQYIQYLSQLGVTFQQEPINSYHSYWMVSVLFKNRSTRDYIREKLKQKSIETRPLFYPAHRMPVHSKSQKLSVAEDISSRGLNLPSWPDLNKSDIKAICGIIRNCLSI